MVITISRQYATNGILIGRLVAEQLGFRVFDRELMEEVAHQMHVNPDAMGYVCEAMHSSWATFLLEWRQSINDHVYRRYLRKAIECIGTECNAVMVGGGANFVLRDKALLNVRIIAPLELRVGIFRAGNEISDVEARRIIMKRDAERTHFVKRVFHEDVDNPEFYDLFINLRGLTPEMAADEIVRVAEARRAERGDRAPGPEATLPQHLRMMLNHRHHIKLEIVERMKIPSPVSKGKSTI